MDGCSTSLTSPTAEEDELMMREDDLGQKEDDRVESDKSEDDRSGYMTIKELLSRFREVEEGNQPYSGLVPPADQPKQEGGGHTMLSDSTEGAVNTTKGVAVTEMWRDMTKSNLIMEGAYFARSVNEAGMETPDGSPCSKNVGYATRTSTEDTQDTQLCPLGHVDKMMMILDNTTPLPSSDRNISMDTDKLSVIDNTNTSTIETMTCPDASTNQPDDTAPIEDTVPDDMTEVQRGMEAGRVADARRITRGVYTMESRGVCSHDKDGVCSIHGPGAVWKHKPGKKTTTIGPDGRTKYRMTKEYFWRCDVGEG